MTDVDFALANVGAGVRADAGLDKNTGARPRLPSFSAYSACPAMFPCSPTVSRVAGNPCLPSQQNNCGL